MAIRLRDTIRAARVKRRQFGLRNLADLAEHLARGSLVETDRVIYLADGFQHACHTQSGELARKDGLVPRGRNEAHGGQVVDLGRLGRLDRRYQRGLVEDVTLDQLYSVEEVLDSLH